MYCALEPIITCASLEENTLMDESSSIRVGEGTVAVAYEGSQMVVMLSSDSSISRLVMPYPNEGVGGEEFIVSDDGCYLALFLNSGQSEVGYELFELEPQLRRLSGLPYVWGEGNAPIFSPGSKWIAIASAVNPHLRLDELVEDSVSTIDVQSWAELRVQGVPHGDLALCARSLTPAADYDLDDALYPEIEFISDDQILLKTPWETEFTIDLPLPESLTITAPRF